MGPAPLRVEDRGADEMYATVFGVEAAATAVLASAVTGNKSATESKPKMPRSDGNHSHHGFEERDQNADMSASNTIIRAGKGTDPRVALAELQEESIAHGYTFAPCFRVRPQGYNPDRCRSPRPAVPSLRSP